MPDAADRKVVVSVHRARKIFGGGHAAEYGSVNPYVVCQYGGAESVTAPVRSTLNPVWNKDLTFAFEDGEAPRATLFLFSKNDYLNDSLLGKCVVNFERPEGHGGTERLLARTRRDDEVRRRPARDGDEHAGRGEGLGDSCLIITHGDGALWVADQSRDRLAGPRVERRRLRPHALDAPGDGVPLGSAERQKEPLVVVEPQN